MSKKLNKKILLDLRLLILLIPCFVIGFMCSPLAAQPLLEIPAVISGLFAGPAIVILLYLVFSWLFYDYFYGNK